jgi:hypothetical protein
MIEATASFGKPGGGGSSVSSPPGAGEMADPDVGYEMVILLEYIFGAEFAKGSF